MSQRNKLYLRPTLIIGLGGSGNRIAVELKARLEERLGEASGYQRLVKFLCFDTANENFTAQYPNNPEITTTMSIENEFVRISDVPLHELRGNRESNPAIAAILPEVLYTTQIDQGAQQVRRLGRVALFHHYDRVKEKLSSTINALRQLDVVGYLGKSADDLFDIYVSDRNRLRVFILCSICGGTGSGTFIDMAYLVRHIAEGTGISQRACDVNAMLLLPEAFPTIVTTGAARIRANAYAALLDLEYYNQEVNIDRPIYEVRMPGETIRVTSSPFSICYLVGGGSDEGTIGDLKQLSPILAEALDAIIATPMGTKLDATLDNVRVGLTLDHDGFRTFYSAFGIAQIVHPKLELKQRFQRQLKIALIRDKILKASQVDDSAIQKDVEAWITDTKRALYQSLESKILDKRAITHGLQLLENEVGRSAKPLSDFSIAYLETARMFQQNVIAPIERHRSEIQHSLEAVLGDKVRKLIDNGLTDEAGGLDYTQKWLGTLGDQLRTEIENFQRRRQNTDIHRFYDRELSYVEQTRSLPLIGRFLLRGRIAEACGNLHRFILGHALDAVIADAQKSILIGLNGSLENRRREIQQAITFWDNTCRKEINAIKQKSRSTAVTQYTLSDKEIEEFTIRAVANLLTQSTTLYTTLHQVLTGGKFDAPGLSHSLDLHAQIEMIQALDKLCEDQFDSAIRHSGEPSFTDDVIAYLTRLRDSHHASDREKFNTLMVNLHTQAEPLLNYSDVVRAAYIRIVGGKTEDEIAGLWSGGASRQSDINYAATGDTSRLTYIVTQHGVPVNMLTRFEDYRFKYEDLKSGRNPIFHLDNKREDEPHNPSSMYFVNLEDFRSHFARALAYDCIRYRRGENVFVLSDAFFSILNRLTEEKIAELKAEVEAMDERSVREHLSEDMQRIQQTRRKGAEAARAELEQQIRRFTKVGEALGEKDNMHDRLLSYTLQGKTRYASTLTEAIEALYSSKTPLLTAMFMKSVTIYERQQNNNSLLSKIDQFLEVRSSPVADQSGSFISEMKFSKPGQTSYAVELYLCALLAVYRRLLKQQIYSQEWKPSGYYLLDEGYLRPKSEGNGEI
jgi:hypothetical protein